MTSLAYIQCFSHTNCTNQQENKNDKTNCATAKDPCWENMQINGTWWEWVAIGIIIASFPMIFHSIDWEARACASLHSSPSQHLTIFKLEFALFATMSHQHRMEKSIDHRCPRCQKFQETLTHVFQCPHGSSICATAWAKAISIIKKTSTCPFIVATLGHSISQWSTGGPVDWQDPIPALDDSIGQVVFTAFQE